MVVGREFFIFTFTRNRTSPTYKLVIFEILENQGAITNEIKSLVVTLRVKIYKVPPLC